MGRAVGIAELPRTWRAVSRYGGAVGWFAQTLWRAFRWRVVGAVVAAQIGVLVVGAGLSLSLAYLQQLEQDGQLEVGGISLVARDETTLLTMVAVALTVLIVGAGILFLAQRRIVAMAVELNHHVRMDIALAYGGELPEAGDWSSERAVRRALWVMQTRDARRTAIVARSMLRNTVNIGIVTVGLAALFYLEASMTVLFLGVMAVAMVSYYRTNAASARATRRYEAVAPGTRQGLRRILPSFQTLAPPAPDRAELEAALDADAVAEETDAFGERFGAHIHAEFLGFAIMGVALAGLTAFMGRQALVGTMPWTRLVAYVLVLRLTMGGIQSLLRTFAFFSRFYPSIDRLNRFFASSTGVTTLGTLGPLPVLVDGSSSAEDPVPDPIVAGEVVVVVLPVPLSRYSLGLLASVLAGSDQEARRRLLGYIVMATPVCVPPTPTSMRTLFAMGEGIDAGTLRTRLGGVAEEVATTVGLDPDAVVPAEDWSKLEPRTMDRLMLVATEASDRPVVAIDRRLVSREVLDRLRSEDRVVLVCGTEAAPADADLGADRTIVGATTGRILATGSPPWVAQRWDEIRVTDGRTTQDLGWDDEELDDED